MTTENTNENSAPRTIGFKFRGNGNEFFGIWFVNGMLTMLTLGFYSPWAKIRTLQYFYGNTELAGSSFQFTANPWALLRTRIIAVLLLILYMVSDILDTTWSTVVFASFIVGYFVLAPVLLIFMLSFRTRYSVWRGVSFGFRRDYMGAYRVYLGPLLMLALVGGSLALPFYSLEVEQALGLPHYESTEESAEEAPYEDGEDAQPHEEAYQEEAQDEAIMDADVSGQENRDDVADEEDSHFNPYLLIPFGILSVLYLILLPYFDFINTRFMVRNSRYGNGEFTFSATARHYYIIYSKWVAATLVLAALWVDHIFFEDSIITLGLMPLTIISVLYAIVSKAYFKSRRANILLSNVTLATHHSLQGFIPFLPLLWLMISNSVVVAVTFGLMGPWAKVRVARFMLERIELCSTESLDGFVERQTRDTNSLAEEVADVFDLDLV